MKKGLLFVILVLSMLCLVSCKGKEKILETSSSNILLPAEEVTVAYIGEHLDKYGTGKETSNKVFKILQLKYAKTILEAFNRENAKATLYFQIESQEQIDAINEYVEEFNENLDKNNVYIEFSKTRTLEDNTECIIFNTIPKKHLVKSSLPEKLQNKL